MTTDDLQTLAVRIAPELARHPFYVVRSDDDGLPPEYRLYGCHGLHAPFLDVALSGWLRDRGRWQGRGPAVLLNVEALKAEAVRDVGADQDLADELLRGRVYAVFAHELAHVAELGVDLWEFTNLDAASRHAGQVVRCFAADDYAPAVEPWHGHNAVWLRLLGHVVYRAERLLDQRLPTWWVCGDYGLTSFVGYRATLDDEPERMANEPLDTIRDTAPPRSFIELWRQDIRRWFSSTERTPEVCKAFADGTALFFSRELIQ